MASSPNSNHWTLLPQSDGYLPYFLLLLSLLAIIHSFVAYTAPPELSMKQFSGPDRPPHNGLTARLYGVKNVYTCLIRILAAYNITDPQWYGLAMVTFVGVIFLNGTELLIYRTARPKEAVPTLATPSVALLWMLFQREHYTSA